MDTKRLKFDNMMEQVERRKYQTKVPAWIRKIMKMKEPTTNQDEEYNNGGGGGTRRFKKQNRDRGSRNKHILNAYICMECKLGQNESFRDIFHPGNVRGMENQKKKVWFPDVPPVANFGLLLR